MKLFNFFRSAPLEEKASASYRVVFSPGQSPVWSPRNYESFSKEGYQINVVTYQAINKIADAIGAMKWTAYDRNGKQIITHPFLQLIRKPNPWQSGAEWWRAKVAYLLLEGQSFDECVLGSSRPQELWTLRPDRMKIHLAANGMPKGYEYISNAGKMLYAANPTSGESLIRHVKLFHPLHEWQGQSPIQAASYAIDQHNEAMKWLMGLLQNSAMPSGALTLDKETTLSDEQFIRLKKEVEDNYSGARNAGRPMLLEGGIKWESLSLSPDEMKIIDLKDSAARDISLAFGVPPLLLNIPGDNTYSNYREARLGFFEDTVIPLVDMLAAEMNYWLSGYYGGVTVQPDYDSIEAIAEKRRNLWEMVDTSDEITVNEARELKGFPPLPAPLGNMLMADLRASRRGHSDDKDPLGEMAYGEE